MKKYIIRKNVILDAGIMNVANDTLVKFNNMKIQTAGENEVVIPSLDEMTNIITEIKNSPWNTKYQLIDTANETVPSMNTLNTLYNGTGIYVERLSDNTGVLLKKTPNGANEISAVDGDAIQVVVAKSGKVVPAVFANNGWFIDTSFNQVTNANANLSADIATLKAENINQDTAISNLSGASLKKDSRVPDTSVLYTQTEVDQKLAEKDAQLNILANISLTLQGELGTAQSEIDELNVEIEQYKDERGNYVRFGDLRATVTDTFNTLGVIGTGNDVTYSFGKTTTLQVAPTSSFRFTNAAAEFYIAVPIDSANHSISLVIGGNTISAVVNATPTELKISGVTNAQATTIAAYRLVSGVQEGTVTSALADTTARTAAATADAKAGTAQAKADANALDITALKTKTDATNTDLAAYKATNDIAVAAKATQASVDQLGNLPVRTINASGTEISIDMKAYTPDKLTNGFVDKLVFNKALSAIVAPTKKITLTFDDNTTEDILVG